MQKKEQTDSFLAEDENGKVVTIVEHTTFTLYKPIAEASSWIPGSRSFSTSSGGPINYLDGDRYQDVMTDAVLTRRR